MTNEFSYYSQYESHMYAFYMTPKDLFMNNNYRQMSLESKVLYGLLLDRNQLSIKNNWIDENGHIFIIFTREEA
jgi:hypothetical protein